MRIARRITVLFLSIAGLLAVLIPAGSVGATPLSTVSRQDATFMRGNAHTDYAEITIGGIALERSSNAAVRMLAEKTISDHQYALSELMTLADKVGVTLPTVPNTSQRNAAARLMSVPADKFDVAYLLVQIAGHNKSIAATKMEIADGSNADVIAFAKVYLPVAEMHLRMATRDLRKLS